MSSTHNEPIIISRATLNRLKPIQAFTGMSLDAIISDLLDKVSGGIEDEVERNNGTRIVMMFKQQKTLGWFNRLTGIVDISDGDGPWPSGIDYSFNSPSRAASAVAEEVNSDGRACSMNGKKYWKVVRTGQTLGEYLETDVESS